jgi:anthranilate synthase component I
VLTTDPLIPDYTTAWPLGKLAAETLISLQAQHPERYPFLLESSAASLQGGNYDMLMAFPGEQLSLQASGLALPSEVSGHAQSSFLSLLDQWWQTLRVAQTAHTLPFNGGWFLYLSYELAGEIEPSLRLLNSDGLIAKAVRIPTAIVRRADDGAAWVVSEISDGSHWLPVQADLDSLRQANQPLIPPLANKVGEAAPQIYLDAVKRTLDYIAAGDIYQANLSRGWQVLLDQPTAASIIYQALRAANPGPFSGLALLQHDHAVICSSPERLLEVRDGWASTRPIAGTRPRHSDAAVDQALLEELRAHPKERAEHIMLLDLERNDLGRICVGGTVAVNEYMSIESYAHVHHIVSNVRGRLRDEVTPGMAIAAMFPGGTITGCPKVRCMEIIAELEHTARGAYTGSMGYLNRDGSMDLNILIRTLEVQGETLRFRAGAGIVADSIPERELDETRAKALGMIRALGLP